MYNIRNISSLFRNTFFLFIFTGILIALCYFWVDPAFSFWIENENLRRFSIFEYFTHLVDAIIIWSFLYYCYFAWSFSKQRKKGIAARNSMFKWPCLNIANSVSISIFIKDILKLIFGRYWPRTFINNNPSLIHDHAYGFHWFHKGLSYQSFPSGHTAIGVAFMSSLFLLYPRSPWRWLGVLVACFIVIGLLANNYHFIGDCFSGGLLGAIVAYYVTEFSKNNNVFAIKQ